MKKSILFSMFAIVAATAVIGFAATQAAFTDSQTASGDVNAGTLNLYLLESADDDNGEDEFVFELPLLENLMPGEFATDSLRLRNDGTSTLTVASLDFTTSTGADCDTGIGGDEFIPSISGIAVGNTIAPGLFVDTTVRVDLSAAAGNDCQGDVFGFKLIVGVSS